MTKLMNKIAVVTGAAQGIGAKIVERLLEDGAKVVALDINFEKLEETISNLDKSGEKVFFMKCNVIDQAEVNDVFETVYDRLGRVDILINNAGITRDAFFHKMTHEQWSTVLDVNLNSIFFTCQAVIPAMRAQEYGKIVNISSTSSWGNMGQANYSASKAGVIGLTRTLAKENGIKNITVNAIAPGQIDTEMTKDLPENIKMMAQLLTPAGRMGKPSEVASVVSFLSSDDSSYVNGECICVSGGYLMP
ncbi:3-oxoacyl-ACP reductase FabG [Sutcliffiella rhizosphaerae]|uniref:3-oxoacyl-[acyl-carrier-protein] reductase FabG n=1 Tax=Sutcliffiella rhizosphaerae TaxID=2880967 RepID=A0ABM8YRQ8_9BACI|nr:3-oxoacyl-ACP reductase FabG [Sutcliffiella rhizosphaerae]CAG9622679.1 3-oxoacyl-[acyl-carrier-protein] reductase FabG [Sutcliffiella rhizosphaerae]